MHFVRLPTEEEIEQTNRYKTYLNYICSIGQYIEQTKPLDLVGIVTSTDSFQKINCKKSIDSEKIAKLIRNSWFTEVQLNLSEVLPEFNVYSNHWAPVQLYYSAYTATRALFEASGKNTPGEHTTNLKELSREISQRPDLFPQPWKTLCAGNSDVNLTYPNLPEGICIKRISSLTQYTSVPFWDSYALCLKTTRERQLLKSIEDWKSINKRKRISPDVKMRISGNLQPTSIFNFLYRMRLKSNYEDIDPLLLSIQSEDDSTNFNKSIRIICWNTLLVLELLIARYIGKKRFDEIVNQFVHYDTMARCMDLLYKRWEIIKPSF
jgi:hypothetical protein